LKLKLFLPLFALSGVWGISFLMIRIADTTFPPLWVALLRCSLGALLLWAILVLRGNKLPPRSHMHWLVLIALLNNALPFTCYALGEETVPSNIAAVLNATVPIWTLLLTMIIERRRAMLITTAGVLIAFAGVVLVVVTQAEDAGPAQAAAGMLAGVLIITVATLSYAVATVLAKAKLRGLDPIGLATTQLTLASLLLLPFALLGDHPGALQAGPIGAIAVLGFAGSGVAYLLYYRLLPVISATQLAAVTYIIPIWGVFWGLLAHEHIGAGTYIGVAVTIGGLVLLNMRSRGATGPK
jgi:drug/metabolite transporter (DMT)-like permease